MSITFSVTCENEQELAYILENIYLQTSSARKPGKRGRKGVPLATVVGAPQAETKTPAKRGPKPAKSKAKATKTATKKTTKKVAKKVTKKVTKSTKATAKPVVKKAAPKKLLKKGVAKKVTKRQSGLTPVLKAVLDDVIAKKKPFRSKDVIDQVLVKHKSLKESSVTTGVNKLLSDTTLNFETIKNPIGRSYKLYKP